MKKKSTEEVFSLTVRTSVKTASYIEVLVHNSPLFPEFRLSVMWTLEAGDDMCHSEDEDQLPSKLLLLPSLATTSIWQAVFLSASLLQSLFLSPTLCLSDNNENIYFNIYIIWKLAYYNVIQLQSIDQSPVITINVKVVDFQAVSIHVACFVTCSFLRSYIHKAGYSGIGEGVRQRGSHLTWLPLNAPDNKSRGDNASPLLANLTFQQHLWHRWELDELGHHQILDQSL